MGQGNAKYQKSPGESGQLARVHNAKEKEVMQIREALPCEIPAVVEMAESAYEWATGKKDFNKSVAAGSWIRFIHTGEGVVFVVFDENTVPAGALCGYKARNIDTGKLAATMWHWFTEPRARGYGGHLLKRFEAWAKAKGCEFICTRCMLAGKSDMAKEIFKHLGYEMDGFMFTKENR